MNYITPEIKKKIQKTLKSLPKEKPLFDDDYFCTYELMAYVKVDNGNDFDFNDFWHFKGIRQLEKTMNDIVNHYKDDLYCVDLKFSEEEGDFDQYTIYTHK